MKKSIIQLIAILSIFFILILFIGYTGLSFRDYYEDKVVNMFIQNMTQEERKNYIANELGKKYGIKCSSVSEVSKRQVSIFENEEYYNAIVFSDKSEVIYVWIENNGLIHDTVFSLQLKDKIDDYFYSIVSKYTNNCIVHVETEFENAPIKEWGINEDIRQMLQTEDVCLSVRIYINNSDLDSVEKLADQIASDITFCDGMLQIYMCDDINSIEIEKYDFDEIPYLKEFTKR